MTFIVYPYKILKVLLICNVFAIQRFTDVIRSCYNVSLFVESLMLILTITFELVQVSVLNRIFELSNNTVIFLPYENDK